MNLFASLVDRALGRAPVLERRRPTVFEPAKNAVLNTRQSALDSLREEQVFADAETPAPRAMTNDVLHDEHVDSRAKSQPASSNATSTVIPKATDITIVEEQPAFKPSNRETNDSDESRRNLPMREQALTQEAPQQISKIATTPSLAPSLETIVETKPEAQVALSKPTDENPFDEIDLVADATDDTRALIANNVVVLQSITQKQTSDQLDESRLLKPVTQRRATRQQMQRSGLARSQPSQHQLDPPAPPTINVTIGRVEVRASAPSKRSESPRPAGPKLSLDEYLRGRKGN